jgi:sugar/nucleoside kinase (ribokinase family)
MNVEKTFDALGIGVAVRDIAVQLDQFPSSNRKYQAKDLFEVGGGPVPTALVTLARLGNRVGFAGVVGDSATGRFIAESLRKEDVDTNGIVFRDGFHSPTSVILVENGKRTILECFQYDLPLTLGELEAKDVSFDQCRFFLMDARLPEIHLEGARRVRKAGGQVVLDCGHPRRGVDELLKHTDIAIMSYTYPETLYGPDYNLEDFLTELSRKLPEDGPQIAGLTLGADGCAIFTPSTPFVRIPGHEVDAVDSTGAGDVFHGAFVHAYGQAGSPIEAARFANAAAALKCRGMTGRFPLPLEEEIRRFADKK